MKRASVTPADALSAQSPENVRRSGWGPAMEQIKAADLTADQIFLGRCRELLGDEAEGLSDEQVDRIRQHAETMANVLIEICLQDHSTMQYR
jgi:hypothetical protein